MEKNLEKRKLEQWAEEVKSLFPKHTVKATGSSEYRTATFLVEGGSSVDVTFEKLCEISKMLGGTKKIDLENAYFSGCETCDYGAVYEVEISCGDVDYGSDKEA